MGREGKEAGALRKALLVVTLVAASFAGGAAVNGPGLKWVKTLIANRLRQADAIPTVAVDAEPPKVEADPPAPALRPAENVPSIPAPPLTGSLAPSASAEPPTPAASPEPLAPAPTPATVRPETPPALTAPVVPPAEAEAPLPMPAASPEVAAEGWADAPGSAPATAVLPVTGPTADAAVAAASSPPLAPVPILDPPGPTASPTTGWPAIRKRMGTLGVVRYWVEGTPEGPVTFRCVVPMPGQAAVSQQFEAEGDDDLQAAEMALRRVSLWQVARRLKGE